MNPSSSPVLIRSAKLRSRLALGLAAAALVPSFALADSDTWANTATSSGNPLTPTYAWDTASNWTLNAAPGNTSAGANASADIATFNKSGSRAISIDLNRTIYGITFTGGGAHQIGSTTGNPLYLSSGGTIQITSGSSLQKVSAPLRIAGTNANYTFSSNGSVNSALQILGTVQGATAGATVLTLDGTNTNSLTRVDGVISNGSATSLSLVKNGTGSWGLNAANTYTGSTTINAGTLVLRAANRISNSSDLILGGGTFATGGFNETLDTLSLTGSSTIDFGSGASFLTFSDSSSVSWTGTLTLLGFDVGVDSLRFGTSASALTLAQLAAISHGGLNASLDNNGFVVFSAIPEPSSYAAVLGCVAVAGAMLRRRRR